MKEVFRENNSKDFMHHTTLSTQFLARFFRHLAIGAFSVIVLSASYLGGYFTHVHQSREFTLAQEAYSIIQEHGLHPLPTSKVIEYGMIRGMLEAYGEPYTYFLEPQAHELQSEELEGSYGDIGIDLFQDENQRWLVIPFPSSNAEKAGIQRNDQLVAVDDLILSSSTTVDEIRAALHGKVGTQIHLILRHPPYLPEDEYPLTVHRQEFTLPSVLAFVVPGYTWVGVLDIKIIAAQTPDEILRSVESLQKQGVTHFIMDLRDNPGGLLTAGIQTAQLFLEHGTILIQQGKDGRPITYSVEKPGLLTRLPLNVLINQNSASAAEIIAGALKAHRRARIIGVPSAGKDTIQSVFTLKDQSSLNLTTALYWIPELQPPLHGHGVIPDELIDPNQVDVNSDALIYYAVALFAE